MSRCNFHMYCIVLYIIYLVVGLVYCVYYFTAFYCLYNLAYWLQYLNNNLLTYANTLPYQYLKNHRA